ncbi:hypothetical protein AVEN_166009-1 [Araneus ventricosus]|uniref:Uncharacterized protein n=1 Tax=Araneus ventricosus TaxID=182803 RepID=A0A4Y2QWA2_ARAVE|nr:hypothetical protein AVEN_166009-1 [Araneus ventricosus]
MWLVGLWHLLLPVMAVNNSHVSEWCMTASVVRSPSAAERFCQAAAQPTRGWEFTDHSSQANLSDLRPRHALGISNKEISADEEMSVQELLNVVGYEKLTKEHLILMKDNVQEP